MATLQGCGRGSTEDLFVMYSILVGAVVIVVLGMINGLSWALIGMGEGTARGPKRLRAAGRSGQGLWALVSILFAAGGLFLMMGFFVTPDMLSDLMFGAGVAVAGFVQLACLALEIALVSAGVWLMVRAVKGEPEATLEVSPAASPGSQPAP